MQEYLGALQRAALFQGMEEEELLALLDCMGGALRRYPRGTAVLQAGDPATHLGVVLSGKVQGSRIRAAGQRMLMRELGPGRGLAVAYACAWADSLPASAPASADTAVLLLDCRRLSTPCASACKAHGKLIHNLLWVLAEKNLFLSGKLDHLSGRTIRERLLSYLEAEAGRTGRTTVVVPFDRQALADYLCVDRSALSRTIGQLQREGTLEVQGRRFRLNNLSESGE